VKLERLKAFVGNLGDLRDTQINPESLEQLEIEEEVYRNVGSEAVLMEAEKRIEKYHPV
jgi:chaperonin cofactor prefoldin